MKIGTHLGVGRRGRDEIIFVGRHVKIATAVRILRVLSVSLNNWARKIVPKQSIRRRQTYKNSTQNAAKLAILSSKNEKKNLGREGDTPHPTPRRLDSRAFGTATFCFQKKHCIHAYIQSTTSYNRLQSVYVAIDCLLSVYPQLSLPFIDFLNFSSVRMKVMLWIRQ